MVSYRGTARKTGRPCEAGFVHLWHVTDDKVSWLRQCTDAARWHDAPCESPAEAR